MDYGAHAEIYEDNENQKNTNKARSAPAICTGYTGYRNPSMGFASLITGRRVKRDQWVELPMPKWVIQRVHNIAEAQGQPFMSNGVPTVARTKNGDDINISDEEVDISDEEVDAVVDESEENGRSEIINDANSDNNLIIDPNTDANNNTVDDEDREQCVADIESNNDNDEEDRIDATDINNDDDEGKNGTANNDANGINDVNDMTLEQWQKLPQRSRRIANQDPIVPFEDANEGANVTPSFMQTDIDVNRIKNIDTNDIREAIDAYNNTNDDRKLKNVVVGCMLAHMSFKQGLKKHGEKAMEALHKEFLQSHDMKTFAPTYSTRLSQNDKKKASQLLTHIEEKRDGRIKSRNCEDGRK